MFQVKEENEEAHEEAPTPREYVIEAAPPSDGPAITSPEKNEFNKLEQNCDSKNITVKGDCNLGQISDQLNVHELSQGLDGI